MAKNPRLLSAAGDPAHVLEDLKGEHRLAVEARKQWVETVDALRDPLIVHDAEFRVKRCNRAYAHRAGLAIKEILGRPYWECFPRGAGPSPECARGVAQRLPVTDEEITIDSGEVFHQRCFSAGSGAAPTWLAVFEDITERKRAALTQQARDARLRSQAEALAQIVSAPALLEGGVERLAAEVTEASCRATGVERASAWLFDDGGSALRCIDLYETTPRRHSAGAVFQETQFRNEFEALRRAPYVDAEHPLTDPRTAGYAEGYLKPLGITSMLDAVIQVSGWHLGVLCLEHVGKTHHWEQDEIAFACRLADQLALTMTRRERRGAQEALARSERYFRKLIEGGTDAFVVVDGAGKVVFRSESGRQLTGHGQDEVVGRSFADLIAPESRDAARAALARRIADPGTSGRVELRLLRKDGSRAEVEVMGRNLIADPDVGGVVLTIHDIGERKAAEERIRRLNRVYAVLSGINNLIVRTRDRRELFDAACRIAVEEGRFISAAIFEYDPRTETLAAAAQMGPHEGVTVQAISARADGPDGQTTAARAVREQRPVWDDDLAARPNLGPNRARYIEAGARAIISLPLFLDERVEGVLWLAASEKNFFDADEVRLLGELAGDLSHALDYLANSRRIETTKAKLRRSLEATIEAIAAALESRDPYTAGHQRRVADLTAAIAREMGLPQDKVEGIHFGALIHDLGKLQVPAEILAKPTRLSKAEFELIKAHPQAGYDIVKGIDFPWPIAAMVHQHHERLDGSGYPQGLKGDAIALEARILAVADVVEAMASHRPYRPGLGIEAALKEITDKRGTAFDPDAVDACVRLFRQGRVSLS